jgi:hypothetical protein
MAPPATIAQLVVKPVATWRTAPQSTSIDVPGAVPVPWATVQSAFEGCELTVIVYELPSATGAGNANATEVPPSASP